MITEDTTESIDLTSIPVVAPVTKRTGFPITALMSRIDFDAERYVTFLDLLDVVCIAHLVADRIKGLAQDVRRLVLVVFEKGEHTLTEVAFNPSKVLRGLWVILWYGELIGGRVRCRSQIVETV